MKGRGRKGRAPGPLAGLQLACKSGVSDDEAHSAMLYWESLSVAERLSAMRFDDIRLVVKVVEVQKELCASDLRCYSLGIRGQDAMRERIGMDKFAVEGDVTGLKPEAFFAKAEFVDRTDLFQYLEAELGTSFLRRRPVLPRDKWFVIFEKSPQSWGEFLRQVLTLAELAVWDVFRRSTQTSKDDSKDKTADASDKTADASDTGTASVDDETLIMELEGGVPDRHPSSGAKRRARKKRQAMLNSVDEDDQSSTQIPSGFVTCRGDDDDSVSLSSTGTEMFVSRPSESDEILQVDWSSAAPVGTTTRLETVEEDTNVELEVDWSEPAEQPEETRWSVGLTDSLAGFTAEWHWITTPHPSLTLGNLMTHTKNTFLEVFDSETPSEVRRRTKSAPAVARRQRRRNRQDLV